MVRYGHSARAEPTLQQQHRPEEGHDHEQLPHAAALHRGPEDQEGERRREHQAGGEDEAPARAQADGGPGAFEWGSVGAGKAGPDRPKTLRFAQARGS